MNYASTMEKSCNFAAKRPRERAAPRQLERIPLLSVCTVLVAKIWQSGGGSRHDVRESGESPELYLQL